MNAAAVNSVFVSYGRDHKATAESAVGSDYDPISRKGGWLWDKNVINFEAIMRIEHIAYQLPDGRVCVKQDDTLACSGSRLTVFDSYLEWSDWNRRRLDAVPDIETRV